MSVTDEQAQSWTAPGAQDAAKRTYASVKQAIEASSRLTRYMFEIFLQGSYANSTNIRGDSDVDVVVMLISTFISDASQLTLSDRANEDRLGGSPGTQQLSEFREDVEAALRDHYGSSRVHPDNKCIKIDGENGLIDADVVPAYQVRRYTSFPAIGDPRYVEGIRIEPQSGGSIVNFPKAHKANGEAKNSACRSLYKPTVRQVKRLAGKAADLGLIGHEDAPGYVLECMVFNVPDSSGFFVTDDAERLLGVMAYLALRSVDDLRRFDSCDRIHRLFVDDPGRHNEYTAKRVVEALYDLL